MYINTILKQFERSLSDCKVKHLKTRIFKKGTFSFRTIPFLASIQQIIPIRYHFVKYSIAFHTLQKLP